MSIGANAEILDQAIAAIVELRTKGCHVHSITNTVAQNFTANVLLACGATVSMTANRDEIAGFVTAAQALHINLGTIDRERMAAIRVATASAHDRGMPVVLDPVMIHRSELRLKFALFIARYCTVIKANAQEIKALNTHHNDRICVVETGKMDTIRFKGTEIRLENGDPLLDRTIATGCALGALIAALLPGAKSSGSASLAGVLWFGVAGEIAAEKAHGPGSFAMHFLDALHAVSAESLFECARVS